MSEEDLLSRLNLLTATVNRMDAAMNEQSAKYEGAFEKIGNMLMQHRQFIVYLQNTILKQEQTITNQQEKISQLEMNASHSDSDSESDSDSDIEEKQENNTLKAKNLSPQLKEDVNGR
jgi:hypothetical protein